MDSVTARFHILTRHQDWNETIYEITPAMKHFTFLFPRLSKAFNCCKMIGSHARWWNDLALSGDSSRFTAWETTRRVSPWWNYFLLSPLRFMQKLQFFWHGSLRNVHDGETPTETGHHVRCAIWYPPTSVLMWKVSIDKLNKSENYSNFYWFNQSSRNSHHWNHFTRLGYTMQANKVWIESS